MSRTAATAAPGAKNRTFTVLAVVLGLVGMIFVYVALSRSGGGSGGSGGPDMAVVVAKTDIAARVKITPDMLEVRLVPQDARSDLGYTDVNAVVGQVTRFPIAQNEQVLSTKVVPLTGASVAANRSLSYVVPDGKRGFAIATSAVQNTGGLLLPGDYVDVLVLYGVEFQTKPGDPSSIQKKDNYFVQTILQNVEVLAVSQTVVDVVPESTPTTGGQRVRNSEAKPDPGASTVTLSLTPEEAQKMFLAEGNGQIRFSLHKYGDASDKPIDAMNSTELVPQNLPNPYVR